MIAVFACLFAFLVDQLDRFERRHAVDVGFNDTIPDRWIVWGQIGERDGWAQYLADGWYFMLKLPSYSWEYNWNADIDEWAQWTFLYSTKHGWRLIPRFDHSRNRLVRDMSNVDVYVPFEGAEGW